MYRIYRKGDENKRLDEINTHCPVYVFLIDLKNNDDVVETWELDYANYADRKRLGRISFWAVMHGHSVEVMNKVDAEPEIVKNG
jgi:hypothetical protein